jgi:ComF family protein
MVGGAVLDLFFPKQCAACRHGVFPFCASCHEALPWIDAALPGCLSCGRPSRMRQRTCSDCPPAPIAWARAPFLFEGPARTAVLRLKFSGDRTVSLALGSAMADALDREVDAVTWVPLSRRRKAHRGYDQAQALARVVARDTALPLVALVSRVRDSSPQAKRTGAARRWAMEGAFAPMARPRPAGSAPPGRVALVDDVMTTGSTVAACGRALLEAGVSEVGVLTAARAWTRGSAVKPTQGDTIAG